MPHHWEGDYIIQNTEIKKKRYVMGSPNLQITTDIREWISDADNTVMKDILKKLVDEAGLPKTKNPGDFDKRAMTLWRFVARNIRYIHDSKKQNKEDFWLFPSEIYTLRQGDCEDGTFLLVSLLIASGRKSGSLALGPCQTARKDGAWASLRTRTCLRPAWGGSTVVTAGGGGPAGMTP